MAACVSCGPRLFQFLLTPCSVGNLSCMSCAAGQQKREPAGVPKPTDEMQLEKGK
jgi:hypothetical protein